MIVLFYVDTNSIPQVIVILTNIFILTNVLQLKIYYMDLIPNQYLAQTQQPINVIEQQVVCITVTVYNIPFPRLNHFINFLGVTMNLLSLVTLLSLLAYCTTAVPIF